MLHKPLILALLAGLTVSGAAHAALESRLNGAAVYDTDLNITWLTNANLIASNTFGLTYGTNFGDDIYGTPSVIYSNGTATWGGAQTWIGAMNNATYLGYSGWRLPTVSPINGSAFNYSLSNTGTTDVGYNVSAPSTDYAGSKGSEMAYLFFNELGNQASYDASGNAQSGYGVTNTGPFQNLQNSVYWSRSEYAPHPSNVWVFRMNDGAQYANLKGDHFYALAVHPGDVAAVPEADTWAMLLAGLGLVGMAARRRG